MLNIFTYFWKAAELKSTRTLQGFLALVKSVFWLHLKFIFNILKFCSIFWVHFEFMMCNISNLFSVHSKHWFMNMNYHAALYLFNKTIVSTYHYLRNDCCILYVNDEKNNMVLIKITCKADNFQDTPLESNLCRHRLKEIDLR